METSANEALTLFIRIFENNEQVYHGVPMQCINWMKAASAISTHGILNVSYTRIYLSDQSKPWLMETVTFPIDVIWPAIILTTLLIFS
jgi:hypothetical protein